MSRPGELGQARAERTSIVDPDGLSELLLRLTVSSTVFCFFMSAPWGFKVPARPMPAFHIMTTGGGWLEVEGLREPIRLGPGDLTILPRGQGHIVRDSPRTRSLLRLDRILAEGQPEDGRYTLDGGGAAAELLCGGFAIDPVAGKPLLAILPEVIHLKSAEGPAPEWHKGLVAMIAAEMASMGPGSQAVITRLTDALLAQALRHTVVEVDKSLDKTSAFSDPRIARALRLMRDHPDQPWTVPKIAAAVSLSRSAFAQRFRTAMGETPMQHLTRYRMSRAAEYLRVSNAGIGEIARLTGYESEVSVSKAFRRQFGVSPGAYRKGR